MGFIAGWGIHPVDIALWGAGELATGTVELEGAGHFPTEGARNTATTWDVDLKYRSGLTMKFVGVPNNAPDDRCVRRARSLEALRTVVSEQSSVQPN